MDCPYLLFNGTCDTGGVYRPSEEEKQKYCNNEIEMRYCPRSRIFLENLRARQGNSAQSVTNVNNVTSNNVNTNNNSLTLSPEIKDTFELAYTIVEGRKGLSEDEKGEITARIQILEKEMGKEQGQRDKGKIERIRQGLEKYGWLLPTIVEIIAKGLGT
jgi:hypothetical protein